MIIVSSAKSVEAIIARHEPAFVLSILDADEKAECLPADLCEETHIHVNGGCAKASPEDARARCLQMLRVAEAWRALPPPRRPIVIHRQEGVSRSTAVAFILLCAIENRTPETELAARLRKVAPFADPNLMLVAEADSVLERDDRMINAILDLETCSAGPRDDAIVLPVAA